MANQKIIDDLSRLGSNMLQIGNTLDRNKYTPLITKAKVENPWFTDAFIQKAFLAIGNTLNSRNIIHWLDSYSIPENSESKKIGLVLAGNLPLVGLHDILCVLLTGHTAIAKLSSKDQHLYKIIADLLINIDPNYTERLVFTDQTIKHVDAIIATGSDNSARYFEHYFGKYPHIIRKNRNSIAVLSGNETDADIKALANDIFTYFGLGCRNVSHLFLPQNFEIARLYKNFEAYNELSNHNKYANNYEYQKAIMLLNQTPFLDNGLVLLKQDRSLASPIGVLHFQFYQTAHEIENYMNQFHDKIQCIVSKTKWPFVTYELGTAQEPQLWDYADNVDTIKFLLNLKKQI
jgi:hypothetical protein